MLVLALLAGLGCDPIQRLRDCGPLIETVNTNLDEVRFRLPDAGSDAAAYVEIAAVYDRLGQGLATLSPRSVALERAVASYRELAERAANTSREYADELARPATSKGERKRKEARLERIRTTAKSESSREASVVRKLNSLCHLE